MRSRAGRLSHRELGLIAAALLVPLPLFALTGLSAPLPNAIERGLGGLVTIDAQDDNSDTTARADASENGSNATRSGTGSLTVAPAGSGTRELLRDTVATSSGGTRSNDQTDQSSTGGDANTQHEDSPDENGGGTGSPDGSGEPGPSGGSDSGGSSTGRPAPSAQIGVTGQGTGSLVTIDRDGLHVDTSADGTGAGEEDPGSAVVIVTGPSGSSTGASVAVPGPGVSIP